MARLLIVAQSATHTDPTKDRTGCYKRGDPVIAMPDGHVFGNGQQWPKFAIIDLPGVDHVKLNQYIQEEMVAGQITRRRAFRVDVAALPAGVRATLNATGAVSTTWAQLRDFVIRTDTGISETGKAL